MTTFRYSSNILIIYWGDRQEVWSEDQVAPERTAGTQTRASRARESSVTNMSAITDHAVEENHFIDWDKTKVVDREAQRQTRWTRGNLDQKDTDLHESGRRILPAEPHMGPGDFQVTCSN